MIVYITKYCSYAVKSMERADGTLSYRVVEVVPCTSETEWKLISTHGGRLGMHMAMTAADEREKTAQ